MEVQLKLIKNDNILYYKEKLKEYIKDLIKLYTEKDITEETNRIYENMKIYTLDNSAIIIGAFDENDLLGFIWGYKEANLKNIIHVNYFYVNQKYRNHGIGRKLLEKMQNISKSMEDITELELFVDKRNKNAISFYNHNNFEIKEDYNTKIKLRKRL